MRAIGRKVAILFGFRHRISLLKNFLGGHFHPKSDTNRHQTRCFFGYWSPMCGRYQLNADFFNRLASSRKLKLPRLNVLARWYGSKCHFNVMEVSMPQIVRQPY
jgi:hypothetical protein